MRPFEHHLLDETMFLYKHPSLPVNVREKIEALKEKGTNRKSKSPARPKDLDALDFDENEGAEPFENRQSSAALKSFEDNILKSFEGEEILLKDFVWRHFLDWEMDSSTSLKRRFKSLIRSKKTDQNTSQRF